ncbi:hypothetical protein A1507_08360 [Methylomonas koyamae]|uniref:Uncharacterized protein n=1 Tax=Methylomonas koyamae TaxID=702114 RepID=A0A177NLK7_9GAMM|nr:hypothetical protein A1507_08360 [Methylomonas koyamae]
MFSVKPAKSSKKAKSWHAYFKQDFSIAGLSIIFDCEPVFRAFAAWQLRACDTVAELRRTAMCTN